MLRVAAAGAIGAYQSYISPYKGFCCAYWVHTGRMSCSEYRKRVILKAGLLSFFRLMPRQFARCREAFAAVKLYKQREAEKKEDGKSHLDMCDLCECGAAACRQGDCTPDACDCSL
jgi:putative component of membrane protein insertase Oxa1/YidC/SpoIIIJ protein YidD